jgi:hypothetical protein
MLEFHVLFIIHIFINLINYMRTLDLDVLIVTLSNLEYLQDLVGVPLNGYDIDINNQIYFFEMLFQSQDLSVELVDGVWLNVITFDNVTYTVHPYLIQFLLDLFVLLEEILFF